MRFPSKDTGCLHYDWVLQEDSIIFRWCPPRLLIARDISDTEPWPRHLDTKPRHQLDTNSTPRHPMPTRPTRHPSTPLDTPRHHLGWYHARPCQGAKLDTSTPLDTARHPSTPLDTARHRSTPLMILTQQRCRPIGVRVRNQGCSSNQTWLAVLSSLSCSLSSSSSSCSSVAPLLMQQTWQYSGSPQVLHSTLYSGNESSHQ